MAGSDPLFGIHAESLRLHSRRAEVLANNIANTDTPGFRSKDLDFAQVLKQQQAGTTFSLNATNPKHIKTDLLNSDFNLKDTPSKQAARDGNTVDSQVETVKFTENALQYQASLNFLNASLRQLMTAVKGE